MKIKNNTLTIGLILLFVLLSKSVFCGITDSIQDYSIKHRWTLKTTVAAYKCWDQKFSDISFGDFENVININHTNFRMEVYYGITKYIELGIFAGFQHYVYAYPLEEEESNDTIFSYAVLKNLLHLFLGLLLIFNYYRYLLPKKNAIGMYI